MAKAEKYHRDGPRHKHDDAILALKAEAARIKATAAEATKVIRDQYQALQDAAADEMSPVKHGDVLLWANEVHFVVTVNVYHCDEYPPYFEEDPGSIDHRFWIEARQLTKKGKIHQGAYHAKSIYLDEVGVQYKVVGTYDFEKEEIRKGEL